MVNNKLEMGFRGRLTNDLEVNNAQERSNGHALWADNSRRYQVQKMSLYDRENYSMEFVHSDRYVMMCVCTMKNK